MGVVAERDEVKSKEKESFKTYGRKRRPAMKSQA